MNVFRENCYTCINSRPPMCELYREASRNMQLIYKNMPTIITASKEE